MNRGPMLGELSCSPRAHSEHEPRLQPESDLKAAFLTIELTRCISSGTQRLRCRRDHSWKALMQNIACTPVMNLADRARTFGADGDELSPSRNGSVHGEGPLQWLQALKP